MKQWLFLEVPKRIFRCVATASLGGTVAPTGGHTRTPLVISQVFSDGGAEDPATGDSAKFERTEGVPTGAVGNLVPHPELHLGGTFFFSAFFFFMGITRRGGVGGNISCTSLDQSMFLLLLHQSVGFSTTDGVLLCCI